MEDYSVWTSTSAQQDIKRGGSWLIVAEGLDRNTVVMSITEALCYCVLFGQKMFIFSKHSSKTFYFDIIYRFCTSLASNII